MSRLVQDCRLWTEFNIPKSDSDPLLTDWAISSLAKDAAAQQLSQSTWLAISFLRKGMLA
jgi:hypothetical protein